MVLENARQGKDLLRREVGGRAAVTGQPAPIFIVKTSLLVLAFGDRALGHRLDFGRSLHLGEPLAKVLQLLV